METAQEGESRQNVAEVDPVARPLLGPNEFRTSLEAVRSAQAVARARARTETRWARLIAAGALMAVGATAFPPVVFLRSALVPMAALKSPVVLP